MLNAVHAGSELGWKSGHLEPFLFVARIPRGTQNPKYQTNPLCVTNMLLSEVYKEIANPSEHPEPNPLAIRRKPGTATLFPAPFAGNRVTVPGFAPRANAASCQPWPRLKRRLPAWYNSI